MVIKHPFQGGAVRRQRDNDTPKWAIKILFLNGPINYRDSVVFIKILLLTFINYPRDLLACLHD